MLTAFLKTLKQCFDLVLETNAASVRNWPKNPCGVRTTVLLSCNLNVCTEDSTQSCFFSVVCSCECIQELLLTENLLTVRKSSRCFLISNI